MHHRKARHGKSAEHCVAAEPGEGSAVPVPVGVQGQARGGERKGRAHAEGGHEGADSDGPVPGGPPADGVHLPAVLERDCPEDQGHQDDEQRQVERGKEGRIPERKGGKRGSGCCEQPDFIPVPNRSDGVEQHPPFRVVACE
ncbi:MAG: hypothetical protein K0R37_871 [Arthrobacter sp.]|nr:hypothetical protein [Arthrobacter sp.]